MANNGTNACQELWVEQAPANESSFSLDLLLDETNDFDLVGVFSDPIHPTSSFDHNNFSPQTQYQQQDQGPSATTVPQIFPSFGGELEKALQAPIANEVDPDFFEGLEQFFQFGGSLTVAQSAPQGTIASLDSDNYQVPTTNLAPQVNIDQFFNEGSSEVAPNIAQGTMTRLGISNYHLQASHLRPPLAIEPTRGSSFSGATPTLQGTVSSLGNGNRHMPIECTHGSSFSVATPTPQGNMSNLGNGNNHLAIESTPGGSFSGAALATQGIMSSLASLNHHVPATNLTSELRIEPSPSVQQPNSQNSLGAANIDAPSEFISVTQANNPTVQEPKFCHSISLGKRPISTTQETKQSHILSRFYPRALPSINQNEITKSVEQQGLLANKPTPNKQLKIGESSSPRNVRKKTCQKKGKQLAPIQIPRLRSSPIQIPSLLDPPGQGSENPPQPSRPTIQNLLYDSKFELLGLPVDPHMRIYLADKRKNGNA